MESIREILSKYGTLGYTSFERAVFTIIDKPIHDGSGSEYFFKVKTKENKVVPVKVYNRILGVAYEFDQDQ